MGFSIKIIFSFIVLHASIQTITSKNYLRQANKCWELCGFKTNMIALRNGEYVCSDSLHYDSPWSPCMMKCLRLRRASDQTKCFCVQCKQGENHKGFCLKPGPDQIEKEDCDRLVCTGVAKYFGVYCGPTPKIRKEIYFDDIENEL